MQITISQADLNALRAAAEAAERAYRSCECDAEGEMDEARKQVRGLYDRFHRLANS